MKTVCKINECAGCMACKDICPKGAIQIRDDLTAYNAVIDPQKCIGCDSCYRVCPQNHPAKAEMPQKWVQGWCADPVQRQKSSSGGFASAISKAFITSGGTVCSCALKDGKFTFEFAETVDDVKKFAGSKYVKSDPSGSYKAVKDKLKNGKKVLFIGLPCQVAALKNFVGKDLESALYTVDLICHGTPSPKLLEMFLKQYKIQLADLEDIAFRKERNFQVYCNNKSVATDGVIDRYMIAFLYNMIFADSCYSCKYAKTERVSDLTIGDSWGSELPAQEREKGISLALCQTEKGSRLLAMSDLVLKDVDPEKAIAKNGQLKAPCEMTKLRTEFENKIKRNQNFNRVVFSLIPQQCLKLDGKALLLKLGLYNKLKKLLRGFWK